MSEDSIVFPVLHFFVQPRCNREYKFFRLSKKDLSGVQEHKRQFPETDSIFLSCAIL